MKCMSTIRPASSIDRGHPLHRAPAPSGPPEVDIVIPVYNEARVLAGSVLRLHRYLREHCRFSARIVIADNASTDETFEIAVALSRELDGVVARHLERKGRGLALRSTWSESDADVVAYMDVDLSTDLVALPALVTPLLEGHGDLAIGSRLAPGADVQRGPKREFISRSYNVLLRILLGVGFSDAQCGFKAGRREVIQELLPEVEDERWFFDTELLYLAQRHRFTIREVPVHWVDDPDSRVDIVDTALEDLRGIARLRRQSRAGGPAPGAGEPTRTRRGRGLRLPRPPALGGDPGARRATARTMPPAA